MKEITRESGQWCFRKARRDHWEQEEKKGCDHGSLRNKGSDHWKEEKEKGFDHWQS